MFANIQIACDLLAIGVILHFSGGVENPVSLFFAFHMIIAGILLSPQMAYGQATLASVVYACAYTARCIHASGLDSRATEGTFQHFLWSHGAHLLKL